MEEMTQAVCLPRMNEPAPDFEANTTHGPLKLSSLRGKWVVLFSHPADFTPVCTTEFIAFAQMNDQFAALNTQLIGLSIDSNYSHIAWVRTIEEKFGVKIPFPVIADLDMKVASLYGMVHPGASSTQAVRAVFIIDDKGILRAMIYYPLSNGRNMDEIKRLLIALQHTDQYKIATPANWRLGDDVIVPPPGSCGAARERVEKPAADTKVLDWFLTLKKCPHGQ